MLMRVFGGGGFDFGAGKKKTSYTNIPEEFHLTYKPAGFKGNINAENAMAILTNPARYKREFNELIHQFNMDLVNHTTERMGLDENLRNAARLEYERQHPSIEEMYYRDFIALQDSTSRGYKSWYGTEITDAVTAMNEVSSKYTCFMLNAVLYAVLDTQGGSMAGKGANVETPCGVAMTEGLRPTIKRMQEMAAIEDFTRSKNLVHQRVESSIAELATREIKDTKAISRNLQTKIWGFSVSETAIEVSATSYIKVGFDLNKMFDLAVDKQNKFVVVTLPNPEILSLEVYPRYDKLSVGWLSKLNPDDLNKDMKLLADAFHNDARKSDVFDNAKQEAGQLMDTMLGPMVASLGNNYRLKVQFQEMENEQDVEIGDQQRSNVVQYD